MIPRLFGRRQAPVRNNAIENNAIEVVLIPRGAAASTDVWALGEALDMFMNEAQARALFLTSELPPEAVAVLRAYEFANALDNLTIGGWFGGTTQDRPTNEVIHGLRLIGADAMANLLQEATEVWTSAPPGDERTAAMTRFTTTRQQEEPLIGQCSDWVRYWPQTVILGDGKFDRVYKEVMKQLHRCNPQYPARSAVEDQRRKRLGLKPIPRPGGGRCSLSELIAEVQGEIG